MTNQNSKPAVKHSTQTTFFRILISVVLTNTQSDDVIVNFPDSNFRFMDMKWLKKSIKPLINLAKH